MGVPAVAPRRAPAPAPRRAPRRAPSPRRAPAPRPAPAGGRASPRQGAASRRRPNRALASSGRAGARVAAPRRAQIAQPALAGAALIPHAAVRTAGAVRDLSDSGLIMRLTRGRGWIALLCALLGGIVALNVISLSLNAGSGRISQQIEQVERSNSGLRAELAEELSASRVEAWAARTGLFVPHPQDVGYLRAGEENAAERLLARLEEGILLTGADPIPTVVDEATGAEVVTAAPTTAAVPVPSQEPEPAPAPAASPPASSAPSGGVGL